MKLYHASLQTRSFSFVALALSRHEALVAMRMGWEEHARRTGAELTWRELQQGGSVHVEERELDACYGEDGEVLARNDATTSVDTVDEALREAEDYFDDLSDADETGQNEEMRLCGAVRDAMSWLGVRQ